ncbi:alkanesulfonate monooxygenase [Pseudonocardia sp. EC080610-09]|uniref:LLM class flavin-dependent oxidoreductase n=1 Tax=unclassified Pseudonocardia TaxID=2619320 RepID=UPI000706BAE8|nr:MULTISPECIES: LLM class flavin-dependent oxidoreductase [unclassified Pseudonocardia]ALL76172.1 alkanesulfonate monooxygenase [Pseudonocardia sp. EC080610-09]ALL83197.1 alkanesulfonate monooxygenase [Pseudonocardia sp. EC080619-01]
MSGAIVPHWFLPTSGDGRTIVARRHADRGEAGSTAREAGIDYLAQIARAAESQGFHGVLTPTGTFCEDAWLTTAALLRETRTLRYLVAFRPGVVSPTLAAQQASTYQRVSGGRLMLNIVTGGDAVEQQRFGDHADHAERYARTDEFLSVLRGAWGPEPFDFAGRHYDVTGATTLAPPDPVPPVYFGGSSDAALPVAARHADVYLTWGEPPAAVAEKIGRVRKLADELGRSPRFGIRLHVITRDTAEEAWAEAGRLLDALDPAEIERAQATLRSSQSVGQQRMLALHGGSRDALTISPNLWAGVGLVRGGAGTALVGSHTEVADRIAEYHEIGVDEFVLSGYPHLEEAYRVGEGVLPELRRRGLLAAPPR